MDNQNFDHNTSDSNPENAFSDIENTMNNVRKVQIRRDDLIENIRSGMTLTKREKRYNESIGLLTDTYDVTASQLRETIKNDEELDTLYYKEMNSSNEEVQIELL